MKVAIMGATGFLGRHLTEYFSKGNEIISTGINSPESQIKLDATNESEIKAFFSRYKPELVIDTVALASSVKCEREPGLCRKLNFNTAKNIAKYCQKEKSTLVFISSSYVFDGERGDYTEKDPTSPTNEYAKNKVLAERYVSGIQNSIILRVDMLYGMYNGKLRFGTRVLDDKTIELGYPNQLRSPVLIDDVPRVIYELLRKNQNGIFNVAGPDTITMKDFLNELSKFYGAQLNVKEVDSSNWMVKSPKNSTLNISKIKSLGIRTTSLEDSLKSLRKDYKTDSTT